MAAVSAAKAREVALKLQVVLEEAREGRHYEHGWYAYMARWDVETLIAYALQTPTSLLFPEIVVGDYIPEGPEPRFEHDPPPELMR